MKLELPSSFVANNKISFEFGLSKSNFIEGKYPVIGGGTKPSGYHNKFNKYKKAYF